MSSETLNSPQAAERRIDLDRTVMLIAAAAIVVFASTTIGFAGQYPVATATNQSPSLVRPCTQLEIDADLLPSECGTLTLSAVVVRMHTLQSKDHED